MFFAILGAGLALAASASAWRAHTRRRAKDQREGDAYKGLIPGGTAATLHHTTSRWADDQGPTIPPQQDRGP